MGGAQDEILVRTQLRLVKMGYFKGILYRNLFLLAGIFWVCVRTLQTALFDFFDRTMLRYDIGGGDGLSSRESGKVSGDVVVAARVNEQVDSEVWNDSVLEGEENLDTVEVEEEGLTSDVSEGKDSPKFLSFRFPSMEECSKWSSYCEEGNKPGEDGDETSSGERSPIDEELSIDFVVDSEFASESPVIEKVGEEPCLDERVYCEFQTPRKLEVFGKEDLSEISEKFHWLSEKESHVSESDSDSMSSSHDFSILSRLLDSNSEEDGFFSDGDLGDVSQPSKILNSTTPTEEKENSDFSAEEDEDTEFKDCEGRENNPKNIVFDDERLKSMSADQSSAWDDEEDSNLESMWEHQDLIEQIKMELEKARKATGLPTIPEDSEGPKIMEDLKPWKIDDRSQHEETIGELHKVYNCYRERMRKFDILNYQKMYALGFLQTKDPVGFTSSLKPTTEGIASLLSQTFKMCRDAKKPGGGDDPMAMFVKELHSDLETVYVGQMCLSWEFLHWQYMKALELWESDQDNSRRYNEVAGEFQQFQVVLQRFLENERFEGSRVQCYVRNRHFLRNLVQIPVIKEDSTKDKTRAILEVKGEYVITSDELLEILEESIRIFWRFVRADKDSSHAFQKGHRGSKAELQNLKDSELLAEVQTALEKKQKKLKEIWKGGNCILRMFQKHRDDNSSDQVLYFFSQVDMMLVRRVLNMSRLSTDQIIWCCGKLSRVAFVRRKIHVEPSFSLFPC